MHQSHNPGIWTMNIPGGFVRSLHGAKPVQEAICKSLWSCLPARLEGPVQSTPFRPSARAPTPGQPRCQPLGCAGCTVLAAASKQSQYRGLKPSSQPWATVWVGALQFAGAGQRQCDILVLTSCNWCPRGRSTLVHSYICHVALPHRRSSIITLWDSTLVSYCTVRCFFVPPLSHCHS